MNVKILFKNHGRGKRKLILVDNMTNIAFTSFGEKTKEYKYIASKYPNVIIKDCQINVIERDKFSCNLECITGHDCVHFR